MTSEQRCNLVIEILQQTMDGRGLFQTAAEIERHGKNGDGAWLKLLEMGANGFLNRQGEELLSAFHKQVLAGDARYSVSDFVRKFMLPERS